MTLRLVGGTDVSEEQLQAHALISEESEPAIEQKATIAETVRSIIENEEWVKRNEDAYNALIPYCNIDLPLTGTIDRIFIDKGFGILLYCGHQYGFCFKDCIGGVDRFDQLTPGSAVTFLVRKKKGGKAKESILPTPKGKSPIEISQIASLKDQVESYRSEFQTSIELLESYRRGGDKSAHQREIEKIHFLRARIIHRFGLSQYGFKERANNRLHAKYSTLPAMTIDGDNLVIWGSMNRRHYTILPDGTVKRL